MSSRSSFTSMIPRYCGSKRSNIGRRSGSEDQFNRTRQADVTDLNKNSAEDLPSRFLKSIVIHLQLSDLKTARLVSKKWNSIIFPIILQNTCIAFTGENTPLSSLSSTELFSNFIRAVPRQGFSWKIRCALYRENVERSISQPYVIPWSHMKIRNSTQHELTPWIHYSHLVNIKCLELEKIILNPKRLYIYLRQFTNLREFRDISFNYICSPEIRSVMDNEDFSSKAKPKLWNSHSYREYYRRKDEEMFMKCPRMKQPLSHVEIIRSQLEDIILHLKLIQLLNCQELVSLKLTAVDTFISSDFVDKNHRLQDIKIDLYKNLTTVLRSNRETLTTLKLAFRHTSMDGWFDLLATHFEDQRANLYKPELAQFFGYVNHYGWKSIHMNALTDLSFEFENKRNVTDEETRNFSAFLASLPKLRTLKISHLVFSNDNYQYILQIVDRFRNSTPENCVCNFQTMYRGTEMNIPHIIKTQLSESLSAIMVSSEQPLLTKFSCRIINNNNNDDSNEDLTSQNFPSVKHFWYGDEIHGGFDIKRFRIRNIVQDFPNLTTLTIKDMLHDSSLCSPDIKRWNVIDDYNMQLIIKNLTKLKYISIFGNLTYLTDRGITGISAEALEKLSDIKKDYTLCSNDVTGVSFSSLKNLHLCCLEFLGSKITDASIQFGFCNLCCLKMLVFSGAIQMSQKIVDLAKVILPESTVVLKSIHK